MNVGRIALVAVSVAVVSCAPSVGLEPGGPELPPEFLGTPGIPPPAGPLDLGPLVRAEVPPPPISGGTLATVTLGSRELAVAADPDRDRIYIVDIGAQELRSDIALVPGDEPGRVAIGAGRAFVALRGAGALATVDISTGRVTDRRRVCAAPRGVAYDPTPALVYVACETGELVTLPAGPGDVIRSVYVDRDLRDVVIAGGRLYVTRFRSAELLAVNSGGEVEMRVKMPAVSLPALTAEGETMMQSFVAAAAWRAIALPDGRVAIVHQRALQGGEPIIVTTPGGYGGGGTCGSGILHAAVSAVSPDGSVVTTPKQISMALAVDIVASEEAHQVAIVSPTSGFGTIGFDELVDPALAGHDGCEGSVGMFGGSPSGIAIAYDGLGQFRVQSREPAALVHGAFVDIAEEVSLSSESRADTGHEIFHLAGASGMACASCHLEGHEDGVAWLFEGLGVRRTQEISGGVLATSPFHWGGELRTFDTLMREVFVGRMGGGIPTDEQVRALGSWVDRIAPRAPVTLADAPTIERGRALFQSAETGCATCHSGARLSNNATVDVGTGQSLQVPSLVGVGARPPYMHDGCAATLRDRFGSCGGGDRHGHTSQLDDARIDDLVAYLESL